MRNQPERWLLPVAWLVAEVLFVIGLTLESPGNWQIWLETSLALSAVAFIGIGCVSFFSGMPTKQEIESEVIYDATFFVLYPEIEREIVAEKFTKNGTQLWRWREGWNLERFKRQENDVEYCARKVARERMDL